MAGIEQIILNVFALLRPYIESVMPGLYESLPQLIVITVSIAVYGVLIYKFYHFVAKRDVFGFDIRKYYMERFDSTHFLWSAFLGVLKYGIIFPIFVFIWFVGFTLLFSVMAKNLALDQLLLVSIAFVTAIRITSYYTEDLSRDLAKMIPLALLGVALIEPGFFSLQLVQERLQAIPAFLSELLAYLVFIILVEWVLRILLAIKHGVFGVAPPKEQAIPQPR